MKTIDHPSQESQASLASLYQRIANGDEECLKFIIGYQHYCHNIDDQVDRDKPENMQGIEDICANYFNAYAIYNSNYWKKNHQELGLFIPVITSEYIESGDTSMMEQKAFLAGQGNLMLKAIAYIQGGWPLLREVTPLITRLSLEQHKILKG